MENVSVSPEQIAQFTTLHNFVPDGVSDEDLTQMTEDDLTFGYTDVSYGQNPMSPIYGLLIIMATLAVLALGNRIVRHYIDECRSDHEEDERTREINRDNALREQNARRERNALRERPNPSTAPKRTWMDSFRNSDEVSEASSRLHNLSEVQTLLDTATGGSAEVSDNNSSRSARNVSYIHPDIPGVLIGPRSVTPNSEDSPLLNRRADSTSSSTDKISMDGVGRVQYRRRSSGISSIYSRELLSQRGFTRDSDGWSMLNRTNMTASAEDVSVGRVENYNKTVQRRSSLRCTYYRPRDQVDLSLPLDLEDLSLENRATEGATSSTDEISTEFPPQQAQNIQTGVPDELISSMDPQPESDVLSQSENEVIDTSDSHLENITESTSQNTSKPREADSKEL